MKKKEYTPPVICVVNMNCVSICAGSPNVNEISSDPSSDTDDVIGVSFTSDVTIANPEECAHSASRTYFEDWD